MDQSKIGKFISQLRKEKSMTQQQLADKLGISDKTVSKWETGKGLPEVSLMIPLCNELGISVNELLSGELVSEEDYRNRAERNIISLIEEKYRVINLITAFSVIATFIAVFAGLCLTLRIQTDSGWIGNASFKFDSGGFVMEVIYFVGFALLFWFLQMLFLKKVKISILKYLPLIISIVGYLFCLCAYVGVLGSGSPSVVAENRYFAMFLCIPVSGAFIGCLLSLFLSKMQKRQ